MVFGMSSSDYHVEHLVNLSPHQALSHQGKAVINILFVAAGQIKLCNFDRRSQIIFVLIFFQ